jgi:hypothetical protein
VKFEFFNQEVLFLGKLSLEIFIRRRITSVIAIFLNHIEIEIVLMLVLSFHYELHMGECLYKHENEALELSWKNLTTRFHFI